MRNKISIRRLSVYIIGMTVLAVGLSLAAQSGLGTSALTAVAFVLDKRIGIPFADATLGMFVVFVLIEILVEKQKTARRIVKLLLQIPLSIAFTQVMGLVQRLVVLTGTGLPVRILVMLLSIVCTGVGAAMTLRADLIPNPGDGVVKALADWAGKPLGNVKNIFDILNVALAAALSVILLGRIEGVGIGTVCAMLGVGRVIALFGYIFPKRIGA